MTDEQYIDIAIEVSKNAKYPYGAIVVKDGEIIGRSDNKTLITGLVLESNESSKDIYQNLISIIDEYFKRHKYCYIRNE